MTSPNWPKQFRAAASTFDWPALAQLAAEYATHLYAIPKPPDSVGQVLLVLRQSRRYEELELVADAALAHGPDAPAVRRHYAQALVDGGQSGRRPAPLHRAGGRRDGAAGRTYRGPGWHRPLLQRDVPRVH